MTLKSVFAPHLNRAVKFGRKRPSPHGLKLRFRDFLNPSNLPPAPVDCDYSPEGIASLRQIFLNDAEGDCVVAGGYHVVGVETGNAGSIFVPTSTQINEDYSAIGGFVPGDPSTDNGCDEQTAFGYWTKTGFKNGTKLAGYLAVDGANKAELMAACYVFENLFFGIELPDAWISPFPSKDGFVWDVGTPNPENGHCVVATGYSPAGPKIDSWALLGTLTWEAISKLCAPSAGGEVYVLLSPDQIIKAQQKAPNNIAWRDLIATFNALGGNVPMPPPDPTPVPVGPPNGVTLAQAQAWAAAGLSHSHPLITRATAQSLASEGLSKGWPQG